MEKELPPKCPTCQLATVLNQMTGDYDCQGCDRSWYVSEFDGESALSSRARKVKLRGWLTAGNNLDDIIIPDKPWVSPPPVVRHVNVANGLVQIIDSCEFLIQFGSEKERKSAILLLFHVYREFGLKPRSAHVDLIDEMCRNYGSLPGKPPEDAAERQTYTCNKCAANLSCPYAWDGYNTNGDCLAEK
jgi:hypothetical protein